MKKLLALMLTLTLAVCGLAGCGDTTNDGDVAGGNDMEVEVSAMDQLADGLSGEFTEMVEANPALTCEEVAEQLVQNELLAGYDLSTYNMLDAEFMTGFDEYFAPESFTKATYIGSMGSELFVAYVFDLDENTDRAEFGSYLVDHAAPGWTDPVISATGIENKVFFVMCAENVDVDYNQGLLDRFQDYMANETDNSAIGIAEYICSGGEFPLDLGAVEVEPGWLAGLDEFDQFAEGAQFAPMIGSIPFVGYVFVLEQDADAEAVISTLTAQANPAWNVCTVADRVLTDSYRDRARNVVLFMMCPENYNG